MDFSLILVGGGKMGSALLKGWIEGNADPAAITVVDPSRKVGQELANCYGVEAVCDLTALPASLEPAVILLAVKPQIMDSVVSACVRFVRPETVFLSIAAGKTIDYFESKLGSKAAIVRAMPNTPAAVGRGIAVACANSSVGDSQIRICHELLESVGECHWVGDQALMDSVTAVSGSGPAYVFLLAECLAQAGVQAGLDKKLAERLARLTVSGSGELLWRSSLSPQTLRESVTSPGGTTAAALDVLMGGDALQSLMSDAVKAAAARSKELAKTPPGA